MPYIAIAAREYRAAPCVHPRPAKRPATGHRHSSDPRHAKAPVTAHRTCPASPIFPARHQQPSQNPHDRPGIPAPWRHPPSSGPVRDAGSPVRRFGHRSADGLRPDRPAATGHAPANAMPRRFQPPSFPSPASSRNDYPAASAAPAMPTHASRLQPCQDAIANGATASRPQTSANATAGRPRAYPQAADCPRHSEPVCVRYESHGARCRYAIVHN